MPAIKCMEYPCEEIGAYTVIQEIRVFRNGEEKFGLKTESLLCSTHVKSLEATQQYFRMMEMSTALKRGEIELPRI
jgi:hypothetical protein